MVASATAQARRWEGGGHGVAHGALGLAASGVGRAVPEAHGAGVRVALVHGVGVVEAEGAQAEAGVVRIV